MQGPSKLRTKEAHGARAPCHVAMNLWDLVLIAVVIALYALLLLLVDRVDRGDSAPREGAHR